MWVSTYREREMHFILVCIDLSKTYVQFWYTALRWKQGISGNITVCRARVPREGKQTQLWTSLCISYLEHACPAVKWQYVADSCTLTLSLTLSLVFCSYTPHLVYRVYRKILASSSFCFFLSLLLPKQLCGTQQKPNTWYSWQPRLSHKEPIWTIKWIR